MNRRTVILVSIAFLLGAALTLSWPDYTGSFTPSVPSYPPLTSALPAILLGSAALLAFLLLPATSRILVATAALAGFVVPSILASIPRQTCGTSVPIALLAIPIASGYVLSRSRNAKPSLVAAAFLASIPIAAAKPFSLLPPPLLVTAALDYTSLPYVHSYLLVLAQAVPATLTASLGVAYLLNDTLRRALMRTPLWAAALSLPLWLCHLLTALVLMRTGGSVLSALLVTSLYWAALILAVDASTGARQAALPSVLLKLAPGIPLLFATAYCFTLCYGAREFAHLNRLHPDKQYTYVHFHPDGTWRRTVDSTPSATRLWRSERFLETYPRSAYRPAALLRLAECQFTLWDFGAAAQTLTALCQESPSLRGYPHQLLACALSAAGDPRAALLLSNRSADLQYWTRAEGALLAGANAERLAMPHRALGFYNAHIEYLRSRQPAAWTEQAALFASHQADAALQRASTGSSRTGSVRLTVRACGKPLKNARVVLVRPHPDAALPSDSRLFTGAWSVAAWNGIWGSTDYTGSVTLTNVPYCQYSVVLGLDSRTARRGYVVSSWIPPVNVADRHTDVPTISLVRSIELTSPKPGQQVSLTPRLCWSPVPGAAHYSVSIIAASEPRSGPAKTVGQTCWARSGIKATSVVVGPRYFTNTHSRLKKGGYYMWIVYAVDKDGRLLTSSEHYAQTHEPAFQVR